MESTIAHFKNTVHGFYLPLIDIISSLKAAKGEFVLLFSCAKHSNKTYRCRIKAPGFLNLQTINLMAQINF